VKKLKKLTVIVSSTISLSLNVAATRSKSLGARLTVRVRISA